MANSRCRREHRTRGRAGSFESNLSGAVGRVGLKLGMRFQGKGDAAREGFFELWGLWFLDGTSEGFLEGLGDSDLVLPRLEDLDKLRFPIFRLPPPTFVVSVASQSLLMLSNVSVFPLLFACFPGDALLLLLDLLSVGRRLVKVDGLGMLVLKGADRLSGTMCICHVASLVLFSSAA